MPKFWAQKSAGPVRVVPTTGECVRGRGSQWFEMECARIWGAKEPEKEETDTQAADSRVPSDLELRPDPKGT